MIWYLPIEPLEERYTEQWYRWFPREFRRQGKSYTAIDGRALLEGKIKKGTFLDINSTIYWKSVQIQKVAEHFYHNRVKDGDVFFLPDAEMFGMEGSIKYLMELNGIKGKIYGFAHAGSYTKEDFVAPCEPFARKYENAWEGIFDEVFVGSHYHKDRLVRLRDIHPEKISVTGNPYRIDEVMEGVSRSPKEKQIIHTNRPDPEKRPEKTLNLFRYLKERHPDWEFLVTTGRDTWGKGKIRETALSMEKEGIITIEEGISKDRYFFLLQTSRIMTGNTIEENFGYCILEALIFGVVPVVPYGFSHTEILQNPQFLFGSALDQRQLIEHHMDHEYGTEMEENLMKLARNYDHSLEAIVGRLV